MREVRHVRHGVEYRAALRTGVGYGIRLSASDRDRYFDPGWPDVLVDVASGEPVLVPISSSFWRSRRELRSAAIGQWLLRSELAPWAPRHPPSLWSCPRPEPASSATSVPIFGRPLALRVGRCVPSRFLAVADRVARYRSGTVGGWPG